MALVVALALDADLLDLHRPLGQLARHAHVVAGDADLALAAGQTHGHAGAAADEENLLMAVPTFRKDPNFMNSSHASLPSDRPLVVAPK